MNELYAEVNVKGKPTKSSLFIRIGIVGGALLLFLISMLTTLQILLPIAAAAVVGAFYLFPRFSKIEYEYIYCDGQLDFDRISGGASRKQMLRIDMEDIDIIAPKGSHYLDNFRDISVKKDFTSREQKNIYVVIGKVASKKTEIYFEPNDKMLNCLYMKSPSKVKKAI